MKYILGFLLFSLISFSYAQNLPLDPETKKITYSEVVNLEGNKDELYQRAKNWALSNGYKAKVDSKEEGRFVATGQMSVTYPSPVRGMNHTGVVKFLLTISVKDGKYKYDLTEFIHESQKGNGGKLEGDMPECGKYTLTLDGWKVIKTKTSEEAPKIINGLKSNMAPVAPVKKNEDW
ncbi:MAG: DUF4468 domain-containing protein [Cytophagaceae bacterium]